MELFYLLCPTLGVVGCLAVAGRKVWRKKMVLEEERRRRAVHNLRAALLN